MNLAPPVYQFLSAAIDGAKDGQLDIHALPGIWIQELWFSSLLPLPLHRSSAKKFRNIRRGAYEDP